MIRKMLFIPVLYFCFSTILLSQSKESIVLIDGKAKEVMLDAKGNVEYVIRDVPNYLDNREEESNYFIPESKNNIEVKDIPGYLNQAYKVLYFKFGESVMSEATISKLDEIARTYRATNKRIMLQTYYTESESTSELLSKNRIDACKSYLRLKGIPSGMISEALEERTKASAKVNVFLK